MYRGAIYGLSAAAIWGGMYVVSDVVLQTVPPFTLLAMRLFLGLFVLWIILHLQSPFSSPPRTTVIKLLGLGMVGFGVSLGAQFVGTDKSTAVNGALVTSASPAFILIFARWILKEQLNTKRILSVLLASLGVVIIIDLRQADFSSDTFIGDMALAIAAITWGLYSVLVRWVSGATDTLVVTAIGFSGGLMLILPAAIIELSQQSIGEITIGIILGILYLGIISTAGAMWLWNRAFALVDASVASLFFFAQPFIGALLAVIFLGQAITTTLWVGGGLIIGGVLLSVTRGQSSTWHGPKLPACQDSGRWQSLAQDDIVFEDV